MTREDAKEIVARLGMKRARLELLERRQKEIAAESKRLAEELNSMSSHAADAAAVLEIPEP